MPSTFAGLLILLVSLAPGFTYLLLAERSGRPSRQHSVFRETAQVVLTSLFAIALTLGLFAILRTAWPSGTPDFGQIVRSPDTYWRANYRQVLSWAPGLLLTSCFLAYAWGAYSVGEKLACLLGEHRLGRVLLPPAEVQFVSAWWQLLDDAEPGAYRYVRCRLTDGSEVAGWLLSFNPEVDEVADRELALSGPIYFTDLTGEVRTNEFGAASVSARFVVSLDVSYHDQGPLDSQAPAGLHSEGLLESASAPSLPGQ